MKQFLKKISILLIIIAFIFLCAEIVIRSTFNYAFSYKHKYIVENGADINTLVLGSSHAFLGIKPDCFETHTFNLSNLNQVLTIDKKLLDTHIKYMPNLKTILITISCTTFRITTFLKDKKWRNLNYSIYMDIPHDELKYNFAILSPEYITYKFKQKEKSWDKLGWPNEYSIDSRHKKWDVDNTSESWNKFPSTYVDHNKKMLEDILKLCSERSINVIGVTTPVWHSLYENIDPKIYNEMKDIIKGLQVKYNFEYYDFLEDSRFTEDDFWDIDHLSNIGAEKFSRILADTLKL